MFKKKTLAVVTVVVMLLSIFGCLPYSATSPAQYDITFSPVSQGKTTATFTLSASTAELCVALIKFNATNLTIVEDGIKAPQGLTVSYSAVDDEGDDAFENINGPLSIIVEVSQPSGTGTLADVAELSFTIEFEVNDGTALTLTKVAAASVDENRPSEDNDGNVEVVVNPASTTIGNEGGITIPENTPVATNPVDIQLFLNSALSSTVAYNDLSTALADAREYADGKIDGQLYDPVVVLKDNVTLASDAEVSYYTVLDLADYTVTEGSYNLIIGGNGKIKANYELDMFDNDPFVKETVAGGVYTYELTCVLNLTSKNLTLSDNIFINATAKATNNSGYNVEYGMTYYKSTTPDNIVTLSQSELTPGTSNKYTGSTEGIPAKDMKTEYVINFFAKTTIGNVTYYAYSNTINYSIVIYARNILSGSPSQATKNLLVSMLNYGSAAQKYYDNDNQLTEADYANYILDPADRVLPDNYEDYMIASETVDDLDDYTSSKPVAWVTGFSLELKDAINIKANLAKINKEYDYKLCVWTLAEYNALVSQAGGNQEQLSALLKPANCSNVIDIDTSEATYNSGKNRWDCSTLIKGISAKKFANTCIIRMVEIDGSNVEYYDWVQSYSPIQYCINQQSASNPKLVELCRCIAVYSAMARVYFDNYTINAG